jgi:hypothetical protein
MNAAMKKARGGFARALDAILINKEFVQDSVTSSQAFCLLGSRKSAMPCKQQEKNRDQGAHVYRLITA